MSERHGIVVTGLGVVSPIGIGTEQFWRALLDGVVGTSELTLLDAASRAGYKGGEVRGFDAVAYGRRVDQARLSRAAQFAVAAAAMALDESGVTRAGVDLRRVGVCFGTVIASRPAVETWVRRLATPAQGASGAAAEWHDPTVLSRAPAAEFGLRGPNLVIPTACAAGNSAIAFGADAIRRGRADAMVVGGADELSLAMLMMFASFRALAPDAVRPFDLNRRGLMLAEGAAALVLESEAHAAGRGARPYGRILGYGNHADAYHMTAPHPDGLGAVRSMEAALRAADVGPREVDYVSAHGTGTPSNDPIEAKAIRVVLGPAADSVPVSSIKSMLGHTQGAASAIEAVSCLLAIRDGIVPPNVNYETPDPACPLEIVANTPRRARVDVALSNAFGFGGNIECVVFGRP